MTVKVIHKKSSVANKVPLTTDLEYGELALNYADGKLYYLNSAGVVQLLNDSTGGGGGGTPVSVSSTPPLVPTNSTLWWDTISGSLFIYYMDGSSGQWVSASTGPQSISALQNSVINFPSSPAINQVYTINEVYYTYDGVKWIVSTNMSLIEQLATEKAIVMAIALG